MSAGLLLISKVSRKQGQNAVRSLAYICRLEVKVKDKVYNYSRHKGLETSFTVYPKHLERQIPTEEFWHSVEGREKRRDAAVARSFILPLPYQLSKEKREQVVREFSSYLVKEYSTAVTAALHQPGQGDKRNFHAHLLMATRVVNPDGSLGDKLRVLDQPATSGEEVLKIRAEWERICNQYLKPKNYICTSKNPDRTRRVRLALASYREFKRSGHPLPTMDSNLDRVIDEAIDEAIFPDDLLFDFLDKEIAEKMRRNPNYNLINLRLDIAGYLHQFELLDKTSKEALFDLKNQNFLERLGQVFDDIKAIATKRPKINLDPQKERLERLVKEIQRSIKTVRVDRIEKEVFARVLAENPNLSYPELGDIYTLEINAVLEEAKRAEVEAKKKAEVAERKAAQAEGKVKTLQEELEKIKTEKAGLQVKVGQITEELNQTKTTLENALSSSSELNQKLTNKSKNLERANQEIDKLKTEKASLESGVAEIKKELDQAKITLENSVSDADSLTNNLKVQLRSKEQKLNKKGRELVKATEKSMELSEELEKIKVEKADLQGKLGQIAEELNQTKTVLESTLSSSININSNLEKQLAEKNQAIESKHRSLEELRQELKELGEEKDILQNKVVEIKEELDQAKTTLENSVSVADNLTNDLKMQLRLKEQELYEKLEESIRAALEFNKLSEELEELKAEKADLEGILEEIAKELSLTQELLISESQAKKAVTKELAQAQENIVNLTNLNSTLETKLITLIDELERLKGKLEATYNYCLNLVVAVRNFDSGFNFRLKPLESYTEKLLDSVKGQLENLYCDLVFESAAQIIRSAPRSYQNRYLLLESDSGISFEYNGELCSVRRNELNCEIAQEIDNYFRWHGQNLETYIEPPPQRKYQQEYPVRGWELE